MAKEKGYEMSEEKRDPYNKYRDMKLEEEEMLFDPTLPLLITVVLAVVLFICFIRGV